MARITVYQGGSIQQTGPQVTPIRAADYGKGKVGEGVQRFGAALGQVAEAADQIADVNAKIEANRLALEHAKFADTVGKSVTQTLGEGAEAAATNGVATMDKYTKDLLGKASPRARAILGPELGLRNINYSDQWERHGFGEKTKAFEATATAANHEDLSQAIQAPTEEDAHPFLASAFERNAERAKFFGWSQSQLEDENHKFASDYFVGRAQIMATQGDNASASKAVDYATANRQYMTPEAYQGILNAYGRAAMDEDSLAETYGTSYYGSQVKEVDPADNNGATRALDPKAYFKSFTVAHEGSAYVVDSNGYGVKYGINAQYNPGVDVKNLTVDKAADVFVSKYWERSGADKLPPALAAVHADTFFLNEKQAGKILKESGGDVDKYIALRTEFLHSLVAKNPAKYAKYQKGWDNRTRDLAAYANRLGGDGSATAFPVTENLDMTTVEESTMARTDIGMAKKKSLIEAYRERRNSLRTEQSIQQSEASGRLALQMADLGDNYTDLKQLDPNDLRRASPETIATLTTTARNNREKKHDNELEPYTTMVEMSDPNRFMTPQFLTDIAKQGASPDLIQKVRQRQEERAKQVMSQKPDPLTSGQLWTVAKPVLETSGLLLDTTEATGAGAKEKEVVADAKRKATLLQFLRKRAIEWATEHPGKTPPEEEVRKWVGGSILSLHRGGDTRVFEANDQQLYTTIQPPMRQEIIRSLMRAGVINRNTPANVVMQKVAEAFRRTISRGVQ
jgi:hypothetical protein